MPWDVPSKTFIRDNGRNTGPTIWAQDAAAAQVVDSPGHDAQDQDIADGITECLNVNGVNVMAADLDMDTNKIVNLVDGVAVKDAVNKGQLDQGLLDISDYDITDMNWSPNTLTLIRAAGGGGNITEVIDEFNGFSLAGTIKRKDITVQKEEIGNTVAVALDTFRTYYVDNDGGVTITLSNTPAGSDPYVGDTWYGEGKVIIWNSATPGTVTVSGKPAGTREIGAATSVANEVVVMRWISAVVGGVQKFILIWDTN